MSGSQLSSRQASGRQLTPWQIVLWLPDICLTTISLWILELQIGLFDKMIDNNQKKIQAYVLPVASKYFWMNDNWSSYLLRRPQIYDEISKHCHKVVSSKSCSNAKISSDFFLKSVHFKNSVARILFLSKSWYFLFWFVLKVPQFRRWLFLALQ